MAHKPFKATKDGVFLLFHESVEFFNVSDGNGGVKQITAEEAKKDKEFIASILNSGHPLVKVLNSDEAEVVSDGLDAIASVDSLKKEIVQLKKTIADSENASVIEELKTALAQSQTEIEELKAELEALKNPAVDAEKGDAE